MSPLVRRILQLFFLVILQAFLLFISSGKPGWGAGWWYLGLYTACLVLAGWVLLPAHQEVIQERSKGAAGAKAWDLWLTRLLSLTSLGILVVAGLDERFDWSADIGLVGRVVGIILFLAGFALVIWAMYANRYFAQVVRIQTERGHVAVTGGPYHTIRHPGYAGMLTSVIGCVLILESWWAFIPAALYALVVLIRTSLEDRTLQAELPGYADYARATRFRLFPGLW